MKVFGQEVESKLLYAYDDDEEVDYDDEVYNWDSMVGLEHLDEKVALQVIDLRYINETQTGEELTDEGKKRIRRSTQRAMEEGYSLVDIVANLVTVLYRIQDDDTIEKMDRDQHMYHSMDSRAGKIQALLLERKKRDLYEIGEAVVKHKSPENFSYMIRDTKYREKIVCAVNWYYKYNQPMVKACRD
jgi:hypothetical protein